MENDFYNDVRERVEIEEDRKSNGIFIAVLIAIVVLVSLSSIIMAIKIRKLEEAVLELENKRKEMVEAITLLEETDSSILNIIEKTLFPKTIPQNSSLDHSLAQTPETTKPDPTPADELNSTPNTTPTTPVLSKDPTPETNPTPNKELTPNPTPTPNKELTPETIPTPPIY